MVIQVDGHELIATFICTKVEVASASEATINFEILNCSQTVTGERSKITSSAFVYCQKTKTISVFKKDDGAEKRRMTVKFGGIEVLEGKCSRFYEERSRLMCHLASSAAAVAYFATPFPPESLKAKGKYIQGSEVSGRTKVVKITLVSTRVESLEPGHGEITHPSPVRCTKLNITKNRDIVGGTMFIHVTVNDNQQPANAALEILDTTHGEFKVPRALVEILETVYPAEIYPPHIFCLIYYLDMELSSFIEDGAGDEFLQELRQYDLKLIVEVVILGLEFIEETILVKIFELIGSELDDLGDESNNRIINNLGFMVNEAMEMD